MKTGSESIEGIMRRIWILFAVFVARMEDTRLLKGVMFGKLVECAGCVGGQEKLWMEVSLTTSELSVSTPTSGQLQPRMRGNGAIWRNKERNVSWENRSLKRKPGLDFGMQ